MFSVIVICVAVAVARADQLDTSTVQEFQAIFYGAIMQHLDAEYKLLQPIIAKENKSMDHCKTQILAAQENCKTCTRDECQSTIEDWVELQLGGITNWFDEAGQRLVDWQGWKEIGGFFGDVGNWFSDAGNDFLNWNGWDDMGNFFSGVGSDIENVLDNVGDSLGSVGNIVGDTFDSIGSAVGSFFGRRRRAVLPLRMTAERLQTIRHRYIVKRMANIDPEVRRCMQKCSDCTPFLGDQTAMIGGEKAIKGRAFEECASMQSKQRKRHRSRRRNYNVCGDQILLDRADVADTISKMKALFDANGNPNQGTVPILTMIDYDKSTFNFRTFTFGRVYVTAVTPGGVVRYPSAKKYNLLLPKITAGELAVELIEKWGV